MSREPLSGLAALEAPHALSIVIPAFNEETRLPRALRDIVAFMTSTPIDYEIIVVDDGSSDGTVGLVERWQASNPRVHLVRLPTNQGKGSAVKAGMLAGRGHFLIFCDADQSTPFDQMPSLLALLSTGGFSIAMGSRALESSTIEHPQAWYRQQMGVAFGLLARVLLVRGFRDCQCGFKAFTRAAALRIFPDLTCRNGLFDMEVILLAARSGQRIAEMPVRWRHDEDSRLTYNFRGALGLVLELLRIRKHWNVRFPVRADVTAVSAGRQSN